MSGMKRNGTRQDNRLQNVRETRSSQSRKEQQTEMFMQRLSYLESIKHVVEKKLKSAPEGTLRVCSGNGRIQYYHRRCPSDRGGVYLGKNDDAIVKKLAEKDYCIRLYRAIEEETGVIQKYLAELPDVLPEDVYGNLNKNRRQLVDPIIETEKMYEQRWMNTAFERNPFPIDDSAFLTDRGELVRSKSELIIANILARKGVAYKYECPLRLKTRERTIGTVYPDFTVLHARERKEIYWEHLGMMDNPEYAEKAVQKINSYNLCGIYQKDRLIVTSETSRVPINVRQIEGIIDCYLR